MPSKWDPFVIWHPPSWFSMWWEISDMTPTMSERMCNRKKNRKKKCTIGETVGNHTIQRVQEEKHKRKSWNLNYVSLGACLFHTLALHLRTEAQYDNLCNYLVPHIYNQGNNFFLKKKTKVNTNHFQNPKKHPLFSLACVDWLILLLLLLFLKLIQCFSVFFHKLYINRPFSSFFCCHQVTLLQNEPPSFLSLHYHH